MAQGFLSLSLIYFDNVNLLSDCLRSIHAAIITTSSVIGNAHQTPVTPIAFPKK